MKNINISTIFSIILLSGCGVNEEEYLKYHSSGVAESINMNQASCLDSSITKIKTCTSIECSVNTNGYFLGCFKNASKSPEICVDVPVWEGVQNDGQWRADQCAAKSADPVRCDILFSSLQRDGGLNV